MNVGERIKQLRKEKKLTLKELSHKADISISFLSDIENGRSNPSLERLKDIAEALDTTISYLLGETSDLGKRIKELRTEKNISQNEMAKILGITQQAVSAYEKGLREPDLETLKKTANFFNVSIDYLLGRSDIRNPYIPEEYAKNHKVKKRDLIQYEEFINQAGIFFMNDEVAEEDKEKLFKDISELFWKAKEINKEKYGRKKKVKE